MALQIRTFVTTQHFLSAMFVPLPGDTKTFALPYFGLAINILQANRRNSSSRCRIMIRQVLGAVNACYWVYHSVAEGIWGT